MTPRTVCSIHCTCSRRFKPRDWQTDAANIGKNGQHLMHSMQPNNTSFWKDSYNLCSVSFNRPSASENISLPGLVSWHYHRSPLNHFPKCPLCLPLPVWIRLWSFMYLPSHFLSVGSACVFLSVVVRLAVLSNSAVGYWQRSLVKWRYYVMWNSMYLLTYLLIVVPSLQADPGPRVCGSLHQGLLLARDTAGNMDLRSQGEF